MQVSDIEKQEGFKNTIKITFTADEYATTRKEVVGRYSKNAKIAGFRKGHVPASIIERNYGSDIELSVQEKLINEGYAQASKKIIDSRAIEQSVTVTSALPTADKSFEVVLSFESYPEYPDHKNTKEIEVVCYKAEITEEDVSNTVNTLLQQKGTWKLEDGLAVGEKTKAVIDFVGSRDGVKFDGGEAKGFEIVVGQTAMIPGFVEQIMGHKAGESFGIEVKFPDNYHATELAGQAAHFDITVNAVYSFIPAELNDEFCKEFNVDNVDALRSALKEQLVREADSRIFNLNQDNLYEASIKACNEDSDLPETIVSRVTDRLVASHAKQFNPQGSVDKKTEALLKQILGQSLATQAQHIARTECAVRYLLSLPEANDKFTKEAFDSTLNEVIEKSAVAYEDPEAFKNEYKKDSALAEQMATIANASLETKILQGLFKVEEKVVSFEELQKIMAEAQAAKQAKLYKKEEETEPKAE